MMFLYLNYLVCTQTRSFFISHASAPAIAFLFRRQTAKTGLPFFGNASNEKLVKNV